MTMQLCLADAGRTLRLGRLLAQNLPPEAPCPTILLQGELGAGKTTLVRGLVAALPGGENAEVSSPSFNVLNLYPTRPETAHVDLYRLKGQEPDDSVAEVLEADDRLVVVEWAQFLPERLLPPACLLIRWLDAPRKGRRVSLMPWGKKRTAWWNGFGGACGEHAARRGPPKGGYMKIVVQKFGGTSVADKTCMLQVMTKVHCALEQGYKVLTVLSAMAGETNRLIAMAKEFSPRPDPAELDVLVATGEQESVALFAMLLKDQGIKARSLLGFRPASKRADSAARPAFWISMKRVSNPCSRITTCWWWPDSRAATNAAASPPWAGAARTPRRGPGRRSQGRGL